MSESFVKVDEWKCPEEKKVIFENGKLVIIPFEVIFERESFQSFSTFIIKKESYLKQMPVITKYINYFVEFYDKDKELIMAYLQLKFIIDRKGGKKLKEKSFIKIMYERLFTPTMVEKIKQMTEDNWYIDVEEGSEKYKKELCFTNEDAKTLMNISMCIKIMTPVLFHYLNIHSSLRKISLYKYYENLFDIFNNEEGEIYEKLWLTTLNKLNASYGVNKKLFDQREILGTSKLGYLDDLVKKNLVSETVVRYVFDNKLINLNVAVLNKQMGFFTKDKYKKNLIEATTVRDSEGLSGLDKLEMNSTKIDETHIVLSKINIKNMINRIEKNMDSMGVTEEEIQFYKDFHKPSEIHVQLVFYYYAKYFGGYRDLKTIVRSQYFKLLVLLKKKLELQRYTYLPLILTSNIQNDINRRKIQNAKFLSKIENSPVYQSMMENKYYLVKELDKPDPISIISTLINTKFTYVDYNDIESLGQVIEVNNDILSSEVINFVNCI